MQVSHAPYARAGQELAPFLELLHSAEATIPPRTEYHLLQIELRHFMRRVQDYQVSALAPPSLVEEVVPSPQFPRNDDSHHDDDVDDDNSDDVGSELRQWLVRIGIRAELAGQYEDIDFSAGGHFSASHQAQDWLRIALSCVDKRASVRDQLDAIGFTPEATEAYERAIEQSDGHETVASMIEYLGLDLPCDSVASLLAAPRDRWAEVTAKSGSVSFMA
jgi:hypothetical protein